MNKFDIDKSEEERRLAAAARQQIINGQQADAQEQQDQFADASNMANVPQGIDAATKAAMAQIAAGARQQREQQSAAELQQAMLNIQKKANGVSAEGDDNGSDSANTDNTVSTAMKAANQASEKGLEESIKENQENNQNYQNFLGKLVEGYQNDLEQAKKEAELQKQIDTNKSVFAGVTEFASAMVNLLGTTQGAVNQQPKTYTQDWMREADAHRQQERERLDRMHDKLRQQEIAGENARYQMTREQIAEKLNLINLKSKNGVTLAQQQKAEQDQAAALALQQEQMERNNEMAERELALKERQVNTTIYNNNQAQRLKERQAGYERDEKGNLVFNEKLYKEQVIARKKTGSSGSGGSSKAKHWNIPAYDAKGLKQDSVYLDPEVIAQTVIGEYMSGNVTDLDDESKEYIEKLISGPLGSGSSLSSMPNRKDIEDHIEVIVSRSPALRKRLHEMEAIEKNVSDDENTDEDNDDWPTEEELEQ